MDGMPSSATGAATTTAPHTYQFTFTGAASEYFRIWIVNLFLSIITLGVYSPWAKVRKKRYFYGHTWVADSNFEYHGNPMAILKGRFIAFGALSLYSAAGYFSPKLAQAIMLVLALLAPWLIGRSMAFNAVNSSYRQIRFHFKARYLDVLSAIWPFILAAAAALLMPELNPDEMEEASAREWVMFLAAPVIAFCFYPFVIGAVKRLHINHSTYGTAPLAFSGRIGQFYMLFVYAAGIAILGAVALGIAFFVATLLPVVGWLALPLVYLFVGAVLTAYMRSRMVNLTLGSTTIASRVQFNSGMKVTPLAKLYFVNLLAISFTLGLMIPWAAVRIARYRATTLSLETSSDLEAFVGQVVREVSATGDEMGEFFDVDLAL